LVRQVCAAVRWDESVLAMQKSGVKRFIEIGPGKVLTGLVKRIAKGCGAEQVDSPASLMKLVAGSGA